MSKTEYITDTSRDLRQDEITKIEPPGSIDQEPAIDWFDNLKIRSEYINVRPKEWSDEEWRMNDGFLGKDFCHSPSSAVRILDYILLDIPSEHEVKAEGSDADLIAPYQRLVGPVLFTPRSESHRGYCHGGSMCAVMDDALGWMGFCVSGKIEPWSGYTVQVNTSLRKPVAVGSILKLEAWVDRTEGKRKIWVKAILSNPTSGEIHCESEGLFLKSVDKEIISRDVI